MRILRGALVAATAGLCLLTGTTTAAIAEPVPITAAAEQVLTWTADDSLTEYASAPATAVAGAATIVFENSTETGNTTGMTHTLTFDTSTPGYNHDVDLNITASPLDAEHGLHQAQVTLTPGKYRYYCAMPGHTMSGELIVTESGEQDTTPPEVTATVDGTTDPDGNYVGTATLTLTATDDSSGVGTVEYTLDDDTYRPYTGPVTITAPGAHTVHYRATDKAGNASDPKTLVINVVQPNEDTTAPVVNASVAGERNDAGNYAGSATVTVTATDGESGVAKIEYTMDGGAYATYSQPLVLGTGTHTLTYRATDKAGNTSEPKTLTVKVDPLGDVTAPFVTADLDGELNTEGSYAGKATLVLAATDTESGIASIEYDLDGAGFVRYGQPVTITAVGTHMLHYRATDRAGNTSAVQMLSFTIAEAGDLTPPVVTVQLAGPQNWSWDYVGPVTVTLAATDEASGVARIQYSLDGNVFTRYNKPFVVDRVGTHTVRYRATDEAGNTSEIGSVTFTVVSSSGPSKQERQPNPAFERMV
ncbi:chitobiase/beta-hexosaminidase C-terminal domain-containing protein [Amycolatopsis sp. NPDC006131]|uniref:OmpL47-type beta-barrel domain-containing protein n=1 Tax=Amycolatopsis sp. NPDC006131 TaxID=3156731 RepID=UPI0033B15383